MVNAIVSDIAGTVLAIPVCWFSGRTPFMEMPHWSYAFLIGAIYFFISGYLAMKKARR